LPRAAALATPVKLPRTAVVTVALQKLRRWIPLNVVSLDIRKNAIGQFVDGKIKQLNTIRKHTSFLQ
jgi:hypothetical protein